MPPFLHIIPALGYVLAVWAHRLLISLVYHAACVSRVYQMPTLRPLGWIGTISFIWSVIISIISLVKYRRLGGQQGTWAQVVCLNYLPRINNFSELYYSGIIMAACIALLWRIHMLRMRQPEPGSDPISELLLFFLNAQPDSDVESDLHEQARRLRYLIKHVYAFILLHIALSKPMINYALDAFMAVNVAYNPTGSSDPTQLALIYYGYAEQLYIMSQYWMFFGPVNIVVKLYHADLAYKAKPLCEEVSAFCNDYSNGTITTVPIEYIQDLKMRLAAHFKQIDLADEYISKYASLTLVAMTTSVTLGPLFQRIPVESLKLAAITVMSGYLFNFVYMYWVSVNVHRTTAPIEKCLYSILAHERDTRMQQEWQKILFGLFGKQNKRSFTILSGESMSWHTFFCTLVTIVSNARIIHHFLNVDRYNHGLE